MAKTKTSKKPAAFSVKGMTPTTLKAGLKTKSHDPTKNLGDLSFIREALMDCFLSNDVEQFKEILKAHYEVVNTAKALKKAGLSKRTFYDALGPKGNPSLSTVMKMIAGLALAS